MKFRKKPVVIDAWEWNPPREGKPPLMWMDWTANEILNGIVRPTGYLEVHEMLGTTGCSRGEPYWDWSVLGVIQTLEGKHIVTPGDFVIRGVSGEFYPCKPDIFRQTYEAAA
jgi:hypothetical protein